MKKAVKLLSLVLCAAMVFTFASCGGNTATNPPTPTQDTSANNNTTNNDTTAQATDTPAATPGPDVNPIGDQTTPYQVDMYFDGLQPPDGVQRVNDAMSQYIQQTYGTNTTVTLNYINWGTYEQTLNPMVASGSKFDIAYTSYWWGFDMTQLGPQGAFIDWTPYIQQVPAWYQLFQPYQQMVINYTTAYGPKDNNGNTIPGIYNVPVFKDLAVQEGIYWNKDQADQYGLTSALQNVKTLSDITPILTSYNQQNPNGTPYVLQDGEVWAAFGTQDTAVTQSWAPGEWFDSNTDNYVADWTDPGWLNVFHTEQQWYQAGLIPDTLLTAANNDVMAGGQWLLWTDVLKPGFDAEQNQSAASRGYSIGSTTTGLVIQGIGNILGVPFVLSKTSANPARAAYAFQLCATDATLTNMMDFGIQGTDYNLDSNGQVQFVDNSGYDIRNGGIFWELGNVFLRYTMQGEPLDLGQQYIDFNNSAVVPKNDTFAIGWTDADKAEANSKYGYDYDTYQAAQASVQAQSGMKLRCGMLSDDDLAAYVKTLTDAGFNQYLQQVNDYYKMWEADPVGFVSTH